MSGAFRNKDNVPGKTTAFSKLRQPTSIATFASVAVRCLFASFAPAQFLRDLCVLCGETPGFPVTAITCVLADECAFPITGSPDHRITRPASPHPRFHPHSSPLIPGDTRLISGDDLSRGSCGAGFCFPDHGDHVAITRDHGDSPGVPGYFDRFVESKRLLTNRPLGHAEISTGSPRFFHWVTQALAWVTQAFATVS